jgi:hypothetical protein
VEVPHLQTYFLEKKSEKKLIYPPGQERINQGRVGLRHGTSHDLAVLLLNSESVNELNNLRGSHSLKSKDFRVMWRPIPETCLSFFYDVRIVFLAIMDTVWLRLVRDVLIVLFMLALLKHLYCCYRFPLPCPVRPTWLAFERWWMD